MSSIFETYYVRLPGVRGKHKQRYVIISFDKVRFSGLWGIFLLFAWWFPPPFLAIINN
jgi:hypothetical protein